MAKVCNFIDDLVVALNRQESEIILPDEDLKHCVRRFLDVSNYALIAALVCITLGFFVSPSWGVFFWFTLATIIIVFMFFGVRTSFFVILLVIEAKGPLILCKLRSYNMDNTNKGNVRLKR